MFTMPCVCVYHTCGTDVFVFTIPTGLMCCVYHPCGDEVFCVLFTIIPTGLIYCVYRRPCGPNVLCPEGMMHWCLLSLPG